MPTSVAELVVILGAGASRACTPRPGNDLVRPPLAAELFDPRYEEIVLRHYPLANAASSDIRVVVAGGAVALEQFLRERLRDSPDPYARRRYLQIPLYLQDLLAVVSHDYTQHPDNFDRVINASLALDRVTFVTLNYDTIFDSRLALQTGQITTLEHYVGEERWALVKLHGSVDWARRVNVTEVPTIDDRMVRAFTDLGEELEGVLDPEIIFRPIAAMQTFRWDPDIPSLFFPALSVPLGTEDELVCPPTHVEVLRHRLQSTDGLNLLVVGYSGVDQEVLKLLRESGNSIRSLFVVNHDGQSGELAARTIISQFEDREPTSTEFSGWEFNTWAQSTNLDEYFEQLS
jgi:hypothetical protein